MAGQREAVAAETQYGGWDCGARGMLRRSNASRPSIRNAMPYGSDLP